MAVLFKSIIEPAIITLIFTIGTLVNRRPRRNKWPFQVWSSSPNELESLDRSGAHSHTSKPSRFQSRPISSLLAYFPFLTEVWYWNLTYWLYQLARAYSAYLIRNDRKAFERAQARALSILYLERILGIDIEQRFQYYILSHYPAVVEGLSRIYHSHICVGVGFITYCYTYLPRTVFQKIRRTVAMDNAIAFLVLTLWRCMPPRLLPPQYGYVDVLHATNTGNIWTKNRFQLTIAAIPSLHFGTALFMGVCLWKFAPHKALRYMALLWPVAMLVTIIVTANHFVTDAVIGAAIPVLGWQLNTVLLHLKPLENLGFQVCGAECPSEVEDQSAQALRMIVDDALVDIP